MTDFTPRPYQVELSEKAVQGNTIVYLPTGSGKTYIAALLIKSLSQDVRIPFKDGGKRTIFAVNTVPLVAQQSAYLSRHTDLTCQGYSGDMNVDFWSKNEWFEQFETNQVLIMTSQIFLDILSHGFMSLSQVNLLIFDECHHAVKEHPMRQIMKFFQNCPANQQPRVLGLSATLLNSNVKPGKIQDSIRDLEITFNAKIITVDSMTQIIGFGRAEEFTIKFDPPIKNMTIHNQINEMMNQVTKVLGDIRLESVGCNSESSPVFQPKSQSSKLLGLTEDIREHFKTMGLYGANIGVLLHMVQLVSMSKLTRNKETSIILNFLLTKLIVMRKWMNNEIEKKNYNSEYENIIENSSDRLFKLFNVLKKYYKERNMNKPFCCIIFVNRRFTAKILYHILQNLKKCNEEYNFIEADYVLGYSNDPYKNSAEIVCIARWNEESLIRFRGGITNVLIATDIVDEGVDIPACSLIIRYDPPSDFRSYVQSKGRARDSSSKFVMFLEKDNTKLLNTYASWTETEKKITEHLIGNTDERVEPIPDDIEKKLYATEIKPYIVGTPDGIQSTLTDVLAISMINRYCDTLSASKFITCSPTYILHKGETNDKSRPICYWVTLKLPIVSPLREIIKGDCMPSISLAKRSAAMKTCIRLHEIGELNNRLFPRGANEIIADISSHLENWEDEISDNKEHIGTYSNSRLFQLVQVESFYAAYPMPNTPSYLHVLEVKSVHVKPEKSRKAFCYDRLIDRAGYAIISSKKLPPLPSFPIYMAPGQMDINIHVNNSTVILTSDEIDKIKRFHYLIFNDILEMIRDFQIFDKDNLDNSFLIVPIDENWKINWMVIEKFKKISPVPSNMESFDVNESELETDISLLSSSMEVCTLSSNSKSLFRNINEDDWQIVLPRYRVSVGVYIVTRVCHEKSPLAPFPIRPSLGQLSDYVQYYKHQHNIELTDENQPMLEVEVVTKKINFLLPKGQLIDKKNRKIACREELLVPELCNVISFPSMYWLKATTLPSILHRINQLLIAEELRQKIVRETGLGELDVDQWPFIRYSDAEYIDSTTFQEKELLEDEVSDDEIICTDTDIDSSNYNNFSKTVKPPITDIDNTEITIGHDPDHFSFSEKKRPIDPYRYIKTVEVIDIKYYNFFNTKISISNKDLMNMKSSKKQYAKRQIDLQPPILHSINYDKSTKIGPSPADIMYALTTVLAGDICNLERLETLGDSFLKYLTSIYLYETYPNHGEGRLTIYKGQIIGNRNLFYCGESKRIGGRLGVEQFVPNGNFITPSFTLPRKIQKVILDKEISTNVLHELTIPKEEQITGELSKNIEEMNMEKVLNWPSKQKIYGKCETDCFIGVQTVKDKCVSDSVEALIGVYLNSTGIIGATKLLKWLGVAPNNLNDEQVLFGPPPDPRLGDGNPNDYMPWSNNIQTTIGYKFKNPIYLLQAFTHASFSGHSITCDYQRLEFLGDALIDFLITVYIFTYCGQLNPGDLTDLRSALVNNITFACLSVKYGLHNALLEHSPAVFESIERFVKFQTERGYAVDDELLWILYEEDECNIAEYVEVPKILGDIFESLIGAIYLDSGKNLAKVWEILYGLMKNEIETYSDHVPKQPVRKIFETVSVEPKFLKAEVISSEKRTMIPLRITVSKEFKYFHGFGSTKSQAKRAAAKQALRFLRKN